MSNSTQQRAVQQSQSSDALHAGIEDLYRAIGIPAVAAAASIMSRPKKTTKPLQRDILAILREEGFTA